MGMFDSLMVACPQCSEQIEYQSKAGDCTLAHYDISDVPPLIAGDLTDEVRHCKERL